MTPFPCSQYTAPKKPETYPRAHGHCHFCGLDHELASDAAIPACRRLMQLLEKHGSLDISPPAAGLPELSTASLFGEARGKMFGALVGTDLKGKTVEIYAFSGQYTSIWTVPGWAPPLFDLRIWHKLHDPAEQKIKELSHLLQELPANSPKAREMRSERRRLSRQLMKDLHHLYRIPGPQGETAPLSRFFPSGKIPTGTGDCCGPKLLAQARKDQITPVAMAEFYWGRANRSQSRRHAQFYEPCAEKCQPLLGFMLCPH